ncbi:MAG TPA: alpha/beta hydrolase [Pseudonocardiaceae bacterium]|nr:alpha/beta hydrolase [Pseudonocardiaceae bacterium]
MTATERVTPWDPAARHRFVTSDGTALHINETGPASDITVVFAHGWTLDHTSWDRVVDAIGQQVRVVRYDHRGHGGSASSPAGTATIAQVSDDLAELIADRIPTGPIVLVGHSMGGMAAMALAERHPTLFAERIAAVGLVATSCGGLSDVTFGLPRLLAGRAAAIERRLNRRVARRQVLLGKPKAAVPALRWLLFGSGSRKADVLATAMQVGRCHPASAVGFRASLNDHERREALAAMREMPVVIMAGGSDRLTTLPHARVIADELPTAELVIYPGAGHMLPYERATDIAAHVDRLIKKVDNADLSDRSA